MVNFYIIVENHLYIIEGKINPLIKYHKLYSENISHCRLWNKRILVDRNIFKWKYNDSNVLSNVPCGNTDILTLEAHISIFGKSLLSEATARHEVSIILGKVSIHHKQYKVNLVRLLV